MKVSVLIAAVIVAFSVGCKLLLAERQAVTEQLETNQLATVTGTHGHRATNYLTVVSTNYVTNTVYDVSPGVTNLLGRGKAVANDLPAPWSWIATSGLGLTSAVLGAVARKKSREAALLPPLIAGVEMANNNADVKRSIRNHATLAGVQNRLHAEVKRRTAK